MYYATEVNSLSTYLPSQYGYPNERNFKVKGAREEKNCSSTVSLNLTTKPTVFFVKLFLEDKILSNI